MELEAKNKNFFSYESADALEGANGEISEHDEILWKIKIQNRTREV
jgi:hypothetical protein